MRRAISRRAIRFPGRKKLSHGLRRLLGDINLSFLEALQQLLGRKIDQLHLIRPLEDRVGDRLADHDAGDLADQVVEALQVLDVESGVDVEAGGQQLLDVLPALGVARAGGVGVGQLVDQQDRRMAADQSGAAVAGATVVITDVQRGNSRTASTDESGAYAAPDLQPGTYKIHVEAKGFKSLERSNVLIEVASDVRADFTLQPGQITEVVTISEDVPLVNTTSATLGGTLSNKEINDLPLNGRNYENLLQLRPGVMRYPGGGFSTTSTNGLRAEDNAYFIEGLFNSEPFSGQGIINGAGIAGDSATILPIDAIQEFNVQENPPAEYGWKPGAIMNVGLKSGTNSLHGTAFAFGRDGAMDARNYFNADPARRLPRTLEQFGGSVGGSIVKDKAFFFGAYEGQRYNVGNSFSVTTPSMVSLPSSLAIAFRPSSTATAATAFPTRSPIWSPMASRLVPPANRFQAARCPDLR